MISLRAHSIGTELGGLFFLAAVTPIAVAYFVATSIFSSAVTSESMARLQGVADETQARIENYLRQDIIDTTTLAKSPVVRKILMQEQEARQHLAAKTANDASPPAEQRNEQPTAILAPSLSPEIGTDAFFQAFIQDKGYYDLLLIDAKGTIIFSVKGQITPGRSIHDAVLSETQLARAVDAANTLMQTEISNFAHFPPSNQPAAFLAAPVFDQGMILGNVILQIDQPTLHQVINRYAGLGKTGEILVGTTEGSRLLITAPSRHSPGLMDTPIDMNTASDQARFWPIAFALEGHHGGGTYEDYRGHKTLALWRYLPSLNWGMVVKIDHQEIFAPIHQFSLVSFYVALGSLVLVVLGMVLSNRLITNPIARLAQAVSHIEKDDLPEKVTLQARHEIGRLIEAINWLIGNVRSHQAELESRVQQRTEELETANAELVSSNTELATTIEQLQRTQRQLIESEKMAALGQLIAGVAHEINTPIGAIKSSGSNIADSLALTLHNLPQLFPKLNKEEEQLFLTLLEGIQSKKSPELTSREERAIARKLSKELSAVDIADARQMANTLIQLKVQENWRTYLPLIEHQESEFILDTAYSIATLASNTNNINNAVDRVSKIIYALKSFARYDHLGEKIEAHIKDGMETVLTIYHNQIKQNTELVRNFQDIPPLRCHPDELNQVWTNLIHNALQAMDYAGTLTIGITQENNNAVVSITDTGKGIPDAIKDKIFTPFFTTKPAGEGSGLGLDIVRSIVEKHQGAIEVESTEGQGSTFRVILPYLQEQP